MSRSMARTAVAAAGVLLATACTQEKTCSADQTLVNGACYALSADPQNCGSVGHACAAAQGCYQGTCVDCGTTSGACTPAVAALCGDLDQVRLLRADNVVSGQHPGLAELGITATTLEAVLPTYLWRYRKGGQYADQEARELAAI